MSNFQETSDTEHLNGPYGGTSLLWSTVELGKRDTGVNDGVCKRVDLVNRSVTLLYDNHHIALASEMYVNMQGICVKAQSAGPCLGWWVR